MLSVDEVYTYICVLYIYTCIGLLSTVCNRLLTGCYSKHGCWFCISKSAALTWSPIPQNERIPKTSDSDHMDKNSYEGDYHAGSQSMSKIVC